MSDYETGPRRDGRGAASNFGWILPLALTCLVIVLAWRLYQQGPHDLHDPKAAERPVTARGDLAADEKATIELVRAASPAVVQVTNLRAQVDWTGNGPTEVPQGAGSGFVWDPQGYVVTNFHVVNGGDAFTVTFADKSTFEAKHVGNDTIHDLAVLKIEPNGKHLPALPIGSSHDLLVGQKVFAFGNPFGLEQTLTTGVISGLGREILSLAQTPIQGVIQTDAAINPGNSGGPLLDSAGRLIGMNTQIMSASGASAGVGFAIPVDTINKIVPQLVRTGTYLRPGLGVNVWPDFVTARVGVAGVMIRDILPESAAAAAGLRGSKVSGNRLAVTGDAIVRIDGQPVENRADLFRILDSREIGQVIDVTYIRDGEEKSAKVTLVGVQ